MADLTGFRMIQFKVAGRRGAFLRLLPTVVFCVAASGCSSQPTVRLGDTAFAVEIAATNEARVRGLSGSAPLAEGRGMLFIFDRAGYHSIWMKDMRFALDIIWISRTGSIVHIERNVHPNTYPKKFVSGKSAKYVLEISAGAGKGVSVGDFVHFENVLI